MAPLTDGRAPEFQWHWPARAFAAATGAMSERGPAGQDRALSKSITDARSGRGRPPLASASGTGGPERRRAGLERGERRPAAPSRRYEARSRRCSPHAPTITPPTASTTHTAIPMVSNSPSIGRPRWRDSARSSTTAGSRSADPMKSSR